MSAETGLSTADVLRRAKQVLVDVGWTKDQFERINFDGERCGVCAAGAVGLVVHGDPDSVENDDVELLAASILGTEPDEELDLIEVVGSFNDGQDSVEPVLAAFDRAIELAEAKR